jgi:hypothetical protein
MTKIPKNVTNAANMMNKTIVCSSPSCFKALQWLIELMKELDNSKIALLGFHRLEGLCVALRLISNFVQWTACLVVVNI